eukprot:7156654-Prymnesium_polylepis.1
MACHKLRVLVMYHIQPAWVCSVAAAALPATAHLIGHVATLLQWPPSFAPRRLGAPSVVAGGRCALRRVER